MTTLSCECPSLCLVLNSSAIETKTKILAMTYRPYIRSFDYCTTPMIYLHKNLILFYR